MAVIQKVRKNYRLVRGICGAAANCLPTVKKRLRNILFLISSNNFNFSFEWSIARLVANTRGERMAILRRMSNSFVKYVEFGAISTVLLLIPSIHIFCGKILPTDKIKHFQQFPIEFSAFFFHFPYFPRRKVCTGIE